MLVITSSNVLLPDQEVCIPATVEVDTNTGKITKIHSKKSTRTDYPDLSEAEWIDDEDSYVFAGLVE